MADNVVSGVMDAARIVAKGAVEAAQALSTAVVEPVPVAETTTTTITKETTEKVVDGEVTANTVVTTSQQESSGLSAAPKFKEIPVEGYVTGYRTYNGGVTGYTSRSVVGTDTPIAAASTSMMRRTYESSASPMNAVSRSVYQQSTGGGATYQARSTTGTTTTYTGAPVMTGQSTYSTSQTYGGQAYGTGYTTTSSQIIAQSRGQETLQGERIVSSNIVGESLLGPMPMEDEVKYIDVPIYEEIIKTVPKKEVVVVEKRVPKYEYEWVDRVVEVPRVEYVDREVEVPQVHEVVKTVKVPQYIDVPREYIVHKPKIETKIVERVIEVPGEIIEVPKPYAVEKRVVVPRYSNTEVPVVVAQRLQPRIAESLEEFLDVELHEYVPKLVTVDVYVPKPVQRPLVAVGRVDEHRVVDVPIAHFNGLLKLLNINLSEEELREIFIKESSGAVAVAPVAGPLVAPATAEWQTGHISGTLHYCATASNTTQSSQMGGYGAIGALSTYTTATPAAGGYSSKTTTTTTTTTGNQGSAALAAASSKMSGETTAVASRSYQSSGYQQGGAIRLASRGVVNTMMNGGMTAGGYTGGYTQRDWGMPHQSYTSMNGGYRAGLTGQATYVSGTTTNNAVMRESSKVM